MTNLLAGIWFFSSLIYRGENLPRPNQDLIMSIHFTDEKYNTLKYFRKNESGFCERKARYTYDNGFLSQAVIWTHPQNASFCDQDADMTLGKVTTTPIKVSAESLQMQLPLGDEILIYVWTRSID